MRKFLLSLFLFTGTALFGNYQYIYEKENVIEDFKNQENLEKYKTDNLPYFQTPELSAMGVIAETKTLTSDALEPDCSSFLLNGKHTATIYSLDAKSGRVECMFAKTNDLYNPIGLFATNYPKFAAKFAKNSKTSQIENASHIAAANIKFAALTQEKREIGEVEPGFLSVSQLLISGVLTDINIIDAAATQATGRLQLRDGYTSRIIDGSETTDNADIIKTDVSTIFTVYGGISEKAMEYFLIISGFSLLFGAVGYGINFAGDKFDDTKISAKKTPYMIGAVIGVLMFFPYNDHETSNAGEEFSIMKTRYQDFEKSGYYFFTNFANDIAKIIIDAELNSLIDKAGLGTSQKIIDTHSGMVQYAALKHNSNMLISRCFETYNGSELTNINSKTIYSGTQDALFPTSEKWAYASSWGAVGGKDYYDSTPAGLVLPTGYSAATMAHANGNPNGFYPKYSFSFCGKNIAIQKNIAAKEKDYITAYNSAISINAGDDKKIAIMRTLTKFQYELYRDWGFLAIIGLPVIKLQTEYLGALFEVENNFIAKANEEIGGNWVGEKMHEFLSSMPYMLLPGASTVYTIVEQNAGAFGAMIGAAATSGGGATSLIGGFIGGVAAKATSGLVAYSFASIYAKTIIMLLPILATILFALFRFLVIIIKIFSFHLVTLLLLPVIFATENLKYFKTFTLKVLTTMFELPIFVLAVWLAIQAHSLIHSIGDTFSKKIIIGMLENNSISNTAGELTLTNFTSGIIEYTNVLIIFVLDGFMTIGISLFSIVIIYKMIITLHAAIFEMIELKGLEQLDDITTSFSNKAAAGAKI